MCWSHLLLRRSKLHVEDPEPFGGEPKTRVLSNRSGARYIYYASVRKGTALARAEPSGPLEGTREALVHAAFELIESDGFAATTATDIAEKAGFTGRTFFRYFPTKEDVVFCPVESRFDEYVPYIRRYISAYGLTVDSLIGALFEANEADPSRRALLLRALELARSNPGLDRRLAYHRKWFTDRIAEVVADALDQDRPDLPVQVIVAVAVTIMGIAPETWVDSGQQTPVLDIIGGARRVAEDGLSGRDGTRFPGPPH